MNEPTTGAVAASVGGAIVAAINWLRSRRKDAAEADLTVGQTWQEIVTELRTDIADLRSRIDVLEDDLATERAETQRQRNEINRYRGIIRSLMRHVLRLRDELSKANAEVPPLPADVEDAMTDVDPFA